MDDPAVVVFVVALFAVIIIVAFVVYRQSKVKITVPFASLEVEGQNSLEPQQGVTVEDIKAGGGLLVDNKTGDRTQVRRVDVGDDVLVSAEKPPPADPKV